jgi:hypothetical protein
MDYRISVSSMATMLQLVQYNFNHAMSQSHKIAVQDTALIEPIIADARIIILTGFGASVPRTGARAGDVVVVGLLVNLVVPHG